VNRLLQIHCAFLFAVLGSGCVNTQLAGDVDPSIDINAYETFYVVHNPDDKRELEKVIAAEITAIGKTATFGTESTAPDGTEVVVTYNSKWMWDITMYLLELNLEFRDPENDYKFASGRSYRTSLARKSPEFMTREILGEIYGIVIPEDEE